MGEGGALSRCGAYNRDMERVETLPDSLAEALERGATVVTGNQRAARTLRSVYDRLCHAQGLASWRPPSIVAWETWTQGLWRQMVLEGHATAMLLNSSQEHAVWRAIVSADAEFDSLRNVDSLAGLAGGAWRLLCQYTGRDRLRSGVGSADTRAFERWARVFARRSKADDLLSTAQIEEALCGVLRSGVIRSVPAEILLVGFDAFVPAQIELLAVLRDAGSAVQEFSLGVMPRRRMLIQAKAEMDEVRKAARWIKGYLAEHLEGQIAVIVPDLAERRTRIDRVFREVLAPELEDIAAKNESAPYEFSLGVPLARTPMVAAALRLLKWSGDALSLDEVSQLLLSPYFAPDENERGGRAEFDAFVLRQTHLLRPEVKLGWLREAIENWRRNGKISRLLMTVKRMQRVVGEKFALHECRSYAGWAAAMDELLDAAGWGAAGNEDSIEFQTRRKWESALDELAGLDFNTERVEFRQALRRLEWIAEQTMFAPESRGVPVQVMGPLEAAGSRFDALWFLGAGELAWPPAASSHPLLSWHVQRELGMPGADRARDDAYAEHVTRRIANSAETVIFSYAAETEHGHQRPSPALEGLRLEVTDAGDIVPNEAYRRVAELERVLDSEPFPPPPDDVIRGGADILKLQAACGFRAFAEKRLWSTELRHSDMGLDSAASGIITHHALEHFWNRVQSQAKLKSLPSDELRAAIDGAIDEALRATVSLCATGWDAAYVNLQRERLRRLVTQWVEVEKRRAPFTVKLLEHRFEDRRIGPLRLDVRVDRVDQGAEGDILIDYKTGRAEPGDWLTGRPDAPQLPLYAVLSDATQMEAVAFAKVRTGKEMTLKGFATNDTALDKRVELTETANLEAQVDRWREVLVALASDFYHGEARVSPKSYPKTCAHCAQRILCRLNPREFEDDSEENEAMEAERG
jgi:ATP-dependent helicase/nuclease subunit B